jgi:Ca2+/H+ antiporter, TMEM165/GDT1 family
MSQPAEGRPPEISLSEANLSEASLSEASPGEASSGGAGAGHAPLVPAGSASWGAVFLTTATTVFLAELGDKTQLAALLLSAESGRPVVVFLGASLALISSSLVGVLLGRWLSTVMAPHQLERAAGVLMVALGLWLGRQAVLHLAPLPLSAG